MPPRDAIRCLVFPVLLILAGVPARAQEAAAPAAPGPSEQEKAILAVDEAFVRDYNAADSKALAGLFTEDAEVIESSGDRYQGRDRVEQGFADVFAASKGAKIGLAVDSIRFLGPDAVKEEGRSVVTPTSGAPVARLYTVLYVRRDGRWLIASVREEADPTVRPHDRLKDLEWLVGDWVDEAPDSIVQFHCRWSEDGNFLIRTYTLRMGGKSVMNGTQRIGWDPIARQFRSWEFDSEGGFGEGRWSRSEDGWVVKSSAVRPEGTTASATNRMTRLRPDMIRWVSTDQVLGDEASSEGVEYVLVRTPPEPRIKPSTAPAVERSPR